MDRYKNFGRRGRGGLRTQGTVADLRAVRAAGKEKEKKKELKALKDKLMKSLQYGAKLVKENKEMNRKCEMAVDAIKKFQDELTRKNGELDQLKAMNERLEEENRELKQKATVLSFDKEEVEEKLDQITKLEEEKERLFRSNDELRKNLKVKTETLQIEVEAKEEIEEKLITMKEIAQSSKGEKEEVKKLREEQEEMKQRHEELMMEQEQTAALVGKLKKKNHQISDDFRRKLSVVEHGIIVELQNIKFELTEMKSRYVEKREEMLEEMEEKVQDVMNEVFNHENETREVTDNLQERVEEKERFIERVQFCIPQIEELVEENIVIKTDLKNPEVLKALTSGNIPPVIPGGNFTPGNFTPGNFTPGNSTPSEPPKQPAKEEVVVEEKKIEKKPTSMKEENLHIWVKKFMPEFLRDTCTTKEEYNQNVWNYGVLLSIFWIFGKDSLGFDISIEVGDEKEDNYEKINELIEKYNWQEKIFSKQEIEEGEFVLSENEDNEKLGHNLYHLERFYKFLRKRFMTPRMKDLKTFFQKKTKTRVEIIENGNGGTESSKFFRHLLSVSQLCLFLEKKKKAELLKFLQKEKGKGNLLYFKVKRIEDAITLAKKKRAKGEEKRKKKREANINKISQYNAKCVEYLKWSKNIQKSFLESLDDGGGDGEENLNKIQEDYEDSKTIKEKKAGEMKKNADFVGSIRKLFHTINFDEKGDEIGKLLMYSKNEIELESDLIVYSLKGIQSERIKGFLSKDK